MRIQADQIRACTRCPDLVRCRLQAVPGEGPVPALFLMVGMAPGRLGADRTGHPFAGDESSRRLQSLLDEVDLRPLVYLTNAVKCAPKTASGRLAAPGHPRRGMKNRDPSPIELENCRPFLAEELQQVQPRIAVALGRVAERALADALERVYMPGPLGVPTGESPATVFIPHPAYWGYRPEVREEVAVAFRTLKEFVGLRNE